MKRNLLFCGVAALAFASCTQNEVLDVNENRAIGFDAFVGNNTRAVTDLTKDDLKKFYVFGDYDAGASIAFSNTEVNGNTGGDYTPVNPAYWITGKTYKFGAYSDGNSGLDKGKVSFNNGTLTISGYEVNDANDLIAATAEVSNATGNDNVQLSFKHLLSKIKFTFSTTAVPEAYKLEVTSITFEGFKTGAGCTFANNAITTEWSGANGTYTVPKLDDYAIEGGKASTDEILVIPQANNSITATITVKMIDEKSGTVLVESKEFTASLATASETVWKSGYVYNYTAVINPDKVNDQMKEILFTVTSVEGWDTQGEVEENITNDLTNK